MMDRLIRFAVVLSLMVGAGRWPEPAAHNIAPQAQNAHPCCPKSKAPQNAGMPYGPNHSCCRLQLPAKLPSIAGKIGRSPDRYIVLAATLRFFTQDCAFVSQTSAMAARARFDSRSVLRI